MNNIENAEYTDLIELWNEYQSEINSEDHIYYNDSEFFITFFSNVMEVVFAVNFGDYKYSDEFVTFDGYGNLESFNENELSKHIDKDELMEYLND